MVKNIGTTQEEKNEKKLPRNGEKAIVAEMYIIASAPEGYDSPTDSDRLHYERGDALPADMAGSFYQAFGDRVIVLDADGNVVHSPRDHDEDAVARTLQMWEDDGFDPAEYE